MPLVAALVPFRAGKTRLAHPSREALAQAFCNDVVAACVGSELISSVHVVGDLGHGLNGDIAAFAAQCEGPVVVILADQPALTSAAIDQVLRAALALNEPCMVSDAEGLGTTMLFAPTSDALLAHFGPRSRAAHRSVGITEIDAPARARRDVDDEVDLWDAIRLGVGMHTSQVLNNDKSPDR